MGHRSVRTVLFLPAAAANRESHWLPGADVYSSRRDWLIKLDLAGVRQGDVTVKVVGNKLVISGCRRDLLIGQDWNHYSMEIAYTRFERAIELPCHLEHAEIRTELSDGMLLIHVMPEEEDNEYR